LREISVGLVSDRASARTEVGLASEAALQGKLIRVVLIEPI
jgi:hypothetical protein